MPSGPKHFQSGTAPSFDALIATSPSNPLFRRRPAVAAVRAALVVVFGVLFAGLSVARAEESTKVAATEESGKLPVQVQIGLAVLLVALSALFAGLTIGIMGLDTLSLEIIADAGAEPDRTHARKLLPVRKMGHQALSTLVLGNMWANVMIAQFCADINPEGGPKEGEGESGASGIIAFLLSTFIILIFTEVLPMSVCKSAHALRIAAAGVPVLRVFIILFYPVAKPLGALLDRLIAHDIGQIYDRNELKKLMLMHCERHAATSGMDSDEGSMIIGALEFAEKSVRDIMTPIEETYCLAEDCVIDRYLVEQLWVEGRSRIPIVRGDGRRFSLRDGRPPPSYGEKQHLVGILYAKDLIAFNVPDLTLAQYLSEHTHREVRHVKASTRLPEVMSLVQTGVAHLLIVRDPADYEFSGREDDLVPGPTAARGGTLAAGASPRALAGRVVGIVTIEDVLEALIKSEIYDEMDSEEDMGTMAATGTISVVTRATPLGRRRKLNRVNFYSFAVDGCEDPPPRMTDSQRHSIAAFLNNTVPAFAFWRPGAIRALLAEAVEEFHKGTKEAAGGPKGGSQRLQQHAVTGRMSSSALPALSGAPTPSVLTGPGTIDAFERGVPKSELLHRRGVASTDFYIVLCGTVELLFGDEGFRTELHTMNVLGEACLTLSDAGAAPFVPAFSARVGTATTRLLRISTAMYRKHHAQSSAQQQQLTSTSHSHGTSTVSSPPPPLFVSRGGLSMEESKRAYNPDTERCV